MFFFFVVVDEVFGKNVVIIGIFFIGTFVELNLMFFNFILFVLSIYYYYFCDFRYGVGIKFF